MNLEFSTINSISCNAESWKNKVFLTFDIDWAPDHVLNIALSHCMDWKVTEFNYDCIGVGAGVKSETNTILRNNPDYAMEFIPWNAGAKVLNPERRVIRFDSDSPKYVIDLVEQSGYKATWFITHDTPVIERLRNNSNFELGIHPNFNPLLNPSQQYKSEKTAFSVIEKLMSIVPEARSIRSHSVVTSSPLMNMFAEFGLSHDSNIFIPSDSGIIPQPWRDVNGMIRVPFFWEDDIQVLSGKNQNIPEVLRSHQSSIKVFDFHPIHVFLNTNSMNQYEASKGHIHNADKLQKYVSTEFGVLQMLESLLTEN